MWLVTIFLLSASLTWVSASMQITELKYKVIKSLENQAKLLEQQELILAKLNNLTSGCDETDTRPSGLSAPIVSSENKGTILLSVNSNGTYEDNLVLNFPVMVDPGHKIMFTFTHFDIEKSCDRSCTGGSCKDWVRVKDSDGTHLVYAACGTSPPGTFFSKTNVAVVTFHSDSANSRSFKGFSLEWVGL